MPPVVLSLSFALSNSLDSHHTDDSSYYIPIYSCGFVVVLIAILLRFLIWNNSLWKKDKKKMRAMDGVVLFVLLILSLLAIAEIVTTFIIILEHASSPCMPVSVTLVAVFYKSATLIFFLAVFYLFYVKSKYDISDSNGSKVKVAAIFVAFIFAVLFIGLEKFLEYVKGAELPLRRKGNKTCNIANANLNAVKRLRPFYVQLCVVLIFFLLAKLAKSSKRSGVLHFWSTPLRSLNPLGGESNIDYKSLGPFVKRFAFILFVAVGAAVAWTGIFISAEATGSTNYYAGANLAEYMFSSLICFLGFGIVKKIKAREPKDDFDVFIAVGLIFSSCFPLVYGVLSIYANAACLQRTNCSSIVENDLNVNICLQIAHSASNLTEVYVQVVLVITIRKLAKDLWSLKVHDPTKQERIYMNAMNSIYSLYVYPFVMAYMTCINFVRYFIDLALEGPIASERAAATSGAEDFIYGQSSWELINRMLFSVGSLFRLLSFFVFLQGTFNVMLSTFEEWYDWKRNRNNLPSVRQQSVRQQAEESINLVN